MEWINPHSWIHLDVKNPDGTVSKWMIEGGTPNTLVRRGFTKDSLKEGRGLQGEERCAARQRGGFDSARWQRLVHGASSTDAPKYPGDGR